MMTKKDKVLLENHIVRYGSKAVLESLVEELRQIDLDINMCKATKKTRRLTEKFSGKWVETEPTNKEHLELYKSIMNRWVLFKKYKAKVIKRIKYIEGLYESI